MPHSIPSNRRNFLQRASQLALLALTSPHSISQSPPPDDSVLLPFANGLRPLVRFPEKRPLLLLTHRPPQLETPFEIFNQGLITPNDAFFVRYHLSGIPLAIDPLSFRLEIKGLVDQPLSLSLQQLRQDFDSVEFLAVNQCSGNSRAFFQPRVSGIQMGNGAMGNARWRGVRLKDLLAKAGLQPAAKQVVANGLDSPHLPQSPDFIKALDIDHATDGEVIVAFEMNGQPLPFLNGFPLRLVVPGFYGTYWIKHLHELTVIPEIFQGFYMASTYRIPATPDPSLSPSSPPAKSVPIAHLSIRSFLTSLSTDAVIPANRPTLLRGITFDRGAGITEVLVSTDSSQTWRPATLGPDLGRYSFREWTFPWTPAQSGPTEIASRAFNRLGETQPAQSLWNPAGYRRNGVESTRVIVR